MRRFLQVLALSIVIFALIYFFNIPLGQVTIYWFNYQITTTLVYIILALLIFYLIYKIILSPFIIINFFFKTNLDSVIQSFISNLNLQNKIEKEIITTLMKPINSIHEFKLVTNLQEASKKNNPKIFIKYLKKYKHNSNLLRLINYFYSCFYINQNNTNKAISICKSFIALNPKAYWSYLAIYNICISSSEKLEISYLYNAVMDKNFKVSSELLEEIHTNIFYNYAKCTAKDNPSKSIEILEKIVSKFPKFQKSYPLLIELLYNNNDFKAVDSYLIKSWNIFISLENTVLIHNYLNINSGKNYLAEINKLTKQNNDNAFVLLAFINYSLGNTLDVYSTLSQVTNKNSYFYKFIETYVSILDQNINTIKNNIMFFASNK